MAKTCNCCGKQLGFFSDTYSRTFDNCEFDICQNCYEQLVQLISGNSPEQLSTAINWAENIIQAKSINETKLPTFIVILNKAKNISDTDSKPIPISDYEIEKAELVTKNQKIMKKQYISIILEIINGAILGGWLGIQNDDLGIVLGIILGVFIGGAFAVITHLIYALTLDVSLLYRQNEEIINKINQQENKK